jgi:UDP-GlcNAc:undecaprenyl-phosphate GlcNAc-1-phosphate transferase
LALPVADSIRVYRSRIKSGVSPFRADKTHLHHLILDFGVKHPAATSIILLIAIGVLVIVELLGSFFSLTLTLVLLLVLFSLISKILVLNREVNTWRQNIARLEKTKHIE